MTIAQMCDVMALLRKAPRSKLELAEVTGFPQRTITLHLNGLESEGHIRLVGMRKSPRGRSSPIYAWNETIHGRQA